MWPKALLRYARALDMQLDIGFCDSKATLADRVKYHLHCLERAIKELLELAGDDLSILAGAAGVFEGAAQQLVKTLVESAEHINGVIRDDVMVREQEADRLRLTTNTHLSADCCGRGQQKEAPVVV